MENKIKVAVLGLGVQGATHVEAAKESRHVESVIGYEPEKARAELRGRELGIKTTSNLEDILADPAIKLVCIASISAAHPELTEKALRAGKAVLCEKPMGETLEEARRMIRVEKETGKFLQIGFQLHYSKLYTRVKEWIDRGLIGTVVNSHCRYYCSEFHLKNTWKSNSKGTLIGEKLSHYLDLQRWWTGSPVESVFSLSAPNAVAYFNHPDNHQISMRFQNGSISSLDFVMHIGETYQADPLREALEKQSDDGHYLQYYVFGTRGAIETDLYRRRLRRWEFSDSPKQLISKIVETINFPKEETQSWIHNTHGQNLRIAELVAKGMRPEVSASDAYETMKVCFAAEISMLEGRIVRMSEYP